MGKILFVAMLALISCKKKYTCTCIDTDGNGQVVQTTNESVSNYPSDAKATCNSREGTFDGNSRNCSLSENQ